MTTGADTGALLKVTAAGPVGASQSRRAALQLSPARLSTVEPSASWNQTVSDGATIPLEHLMQEVIGRIIEHGDIVPGRHMTHDIGQPGMSDTLVSMQNSNILIYSVPNYLGRVFPSLGCSLWLKPHYTH